MFVEEVDGHVLDILDEGIFLLNKEICVLCHALVDLMVVGNFFTGDDAFRGEVLVLKILIGLFEV